MNLQFHSFPQIKATQIHNMKLIDVIIFELKPKLEPIYFERVLSLVGYVENIMRNSLKNTAISIYLYPKYDRLNLEFENTFKQILHLFKPKYIDNESAKTVDKCIVFDIMTHAIHNNLYHEFYYLFPLDVAKIILQYYGSSSLYNNMQLQVSYPQRETIEHWYHYLAMVPFTNSLSGFILWGMGRMLPPANSDLRI